MTRPLSIPRKLHTIWAKLAEPTLVRMSLRTMPDSSSALTTLPLALLEPSPG